MLKVIIYTLCILFPVISNAKDLHNPEDYRQCVSSIRFFERKYQLPKNLLQAINIVESGKWNSKLQSKAPWPWTLNIDGKPKYYKTKQEALKGIEEALQNGARNIDIGCSQISSKFHGIHFPSLNRLLTPLKNTEYAAKFLKKNYEKTKNWDKAISHYHSKSLIRGNRYLKKVKKEWNILNQQDSRSIRTQDSRRKVNSLVYSTKAQQQ